MVKITRVKSTYENNWSKNIAIPKIFHTFTPAGASILLVGASRPWQFFKLQKEKNARTGGGSPRTIYFYKVLKAKTARVGGESPRTVY